MFVFYRLQAAFVCFLVVLFQNVYSATIQQGALERHYRVSVVKPSVPSAALEESVIANDDNSTNHNGFFNKIGKQMSNMFAHSSKNNNGSQAQDSESNNMTKTVNGLGSENATLTSTRNEAAVPNWMTGKNTTVEVSPMPTKIRLKPAEKRELARRSKEVLSANSTTAKEFKATTEDIVTTRMRLTSFIESISASLESIHRTLREFPWTKQKDPYSIVSRNDSMLVAAVMGKRFHSVEGDYKVKPVRAVFHKHKLTVEIEESSFAENRDNSSKLSEGVSGIGTEYQFIIHKAYVDVEEIYLRPINGQIPGYEIIIPLQPEANLDKEAQAVSRNLNKSTSLSEVRAGHWGTSREEDEYLFLQAQMECQKTHGVSGIRKLVCTCEKVHTENVTRRLLCMSRVADKVVKVAQASGEGRVAARVYRGSIRCRNTRYGIQGSYDCMTKLLEKHAGEDSKLHKKYGRNILSWTDKAARKVDDMVGRVHVKAEEFVDFNEEGKADVMGRRRFSVLHALTFVMYVTGIAFLVFCLVDVGIQYRRHRLESHTDGRVSRLSAQAQALYSRLVMRNE